MTVQADAATLTVAEAAAILNPPICETRLREIVIALGWQPVAWHHPGGRGHPTGAYSAAEIRALHYALTPFLRHDGRHACA